MRTLKNKVQKLDNIDKAGLLFGLLVILPLLVIITIDLITNGANLI